jgi:uncharacterized protein
MKRGFHIFLVAALIQACFPVDRRTQKPSIIENRVIDDAGLLTVEQEMKIFEQIQKLEKNVGSQIAVITIDTLKGLDIDQYSFQKAEELSLGRDIQKDGLLITVASKDRQARIEVGYGLVRIVTNEISSQIMSDVMVPKFKEGKFYEGIYESIATIKSMIESNEGSIGQAN